jgi:hypothetical protein
VERGLIRVATVFETTPQVIQMNETATVVESIYRLQRRSIERNRRALHASVELGERANRLALDAVDAWRSLERHGGGLPRTAVRTYAEETAETVPGADRAVRDALAAYESQVDAVDEVDEQAWDATQALLSENAAAAETVARRYLEVVDASTEAALETLAAFEEGVATDER